MTTNHPDNRCIRCGQPGHTSDECRKWPACTDCTTAMHRAWHGVQASCKGCIARMFAQGLQFFDSQKAGRLLPAYSAALKVQFGDDWKEWHEVVKHWAQRMEAPPC